ncbi:hypothetical protein ES703_116904 [subsurface metagenome]
MKIIRYVPGPVAVAPTFHTLPAAAPDIDEVVAAEITRVPVGMGSLTDHTQAEVVDAILDHSQAVIVAAVLEHPVHQHDITMVGPAGGGGAVTAPAIPGSIEEAGGGAVMTGAVDNLGAVQDHLDGVNPVGHAVGANPVPHGVAADPIVAVPTVIRITARTFTLDVATLAGDLLTLAYLEVGERVLVS